MAKKIENTGVQLKEGQKVLGIDGNEYLIEKGDVLSFKEAGTRESDRAEEMVQIIFGGDYESAFNAWISQASSDEVDDAVDYIEQMYGY